MPQSRTGSPQLASGRSSLLDMQHAACPQAAEDFAHCTWLQVSQSQAWQYSMKLSQTPFAQAQAIKAGSTIYHL